ncbi:acetylglutamate kinase [Natronoglycomyces albus]|uniref:acetylglutamate kinase n=1 Tax=Natronoglycomyces albus TaxID=2811108 RepID=UPI001FEB15F2|nr:acetylglutamate kinase [Natronoglycomyces albus]
MTTSTAVIKYGGNAMTSLALQQQFAANLLCLSEHGIQPIVVHGGGPQISAMLDRFGIESEFKGGLRVTTPDMIDIVRMVLHGQVNRELVGHINQLQPVAVGLSGEDAGLLTAVKRYADIDGQPVDIGRVGDAGSVNPSILRDLLTSGRIPVVSTLAPDAGGAVHNLNADTAAAAIAAAIKADKFIVLTDVTGLYSNWPETDSLIPNLDTEALKGMLAHLSAGMVPKAEGCLRAVEAGVGTAHIIDGRDSSALLRAALAEGTPVGTTVTPAPGGNS